MIAHSKTIRKSVESESKPTASFTSRTRNQDFPFEHVQASFFGFTECDYKVRQFSYRRTGSMALSRKNRFRTRRAPSMR